MLLKKLFFILLFLLSINTIKAYDYSILLTYPTNEQTELQSGFTMLTWQVSPTVTSSNYLKYLVTIMTIDENEEVPADLDDCNACTTVVNDLISFQSESGSYTFNPIDCKKYVWQITLIEDIPSGTTPDGTPIPASQEVLGKSLVHSFITECSNISNRIGSVQHQYITFPTENTSYVYGIPSNSSKLYFKYESEYNNQTISYVIFDKNHEVVGAPGTIDQIHKGVNYEFVTLQNLNQGAIYFLEVKNEKDIIKSLKFRIE